MSDRSRQGFIHLFADSRDALRRYVRRLVRSRETAEDIVQEAYLRIYARREETSEPRAFLFSIARNLASNVRRHDRVAETFRLMKGDADDFFQSESMEDSLLADERIRVLKQAVEGLTPQCRAALTLRVFHDCSYKEIATRLAISEKTVEKHIALGLRGVHAYLAHQYKEVQHRD